ncbi:TfoX/Sxy family protein [Robiginitalea sp. IMCC44478]|uniref:TfoX/Sxy family protein n=1 Tax=Robiginitalea sp. IMCC44478 TaxID=3459122 RepID=UPI0040428728
MAYDQQIEQELNELIMELGPEIFESMQVKKMFGGLAYLFRGKMTVGILKDSLIARVIPAKMESTLQEDWVSPMDFSGKVMKEFVQVSPEGLQSRKELRYWLLLGLEHAKSKLE